MIYRFGYKKASKNGILLMQIFFSKNIDFQLSKTVPIMFLSFLDKKLRHFEVHQNRPKKGGGSEKKNVTISNFDFFSFLSAQKS